jgi:four helix bundle protein
MNKSIQEDNIILNKSLQFALDVISFCDILEQEKKFVIARQLLKSGTSIGANIREAQHAESRADFIHKMKIAIKEAEETNYWLELCRMSSSYPTPINLAEDLEQIIKILSKIIFTSKQSK